VVKVVQKKKRHSLFRPHPQLLKSGVSALKIIIQVHHKGEVASFPLVANVALVEVSFKLVPALVTVKSKQLVEPNGSAGSQRR
jgi:hypothetical protein